MTEETVFGGQPEPSGTWTAYPSLLQTLSPEAQTALEEAACAHYCGRYTDANDGFATNLPPARSSLVVCLQRADMLTHQSMEVERIQMLEQAIEQLRPTCSVSENLLLRFMLADAKLWAFGLPRPLAEMVYNVRNHFRTVDMESLSDIEFRCIILYYDSVRNLRKISNFVDVQYETIFQHFNGNSSIELKKLREVLLSQGRWRLVPTALQMELNHISPGLELKALLDLSSHIAKTLDSLKSPPLKFRSVTLRKSISDTVASIVPAWSDHERHLYLTTLRTLKDIAIEREFPSWDQFAPAIAFDLIKRTILMSNHLEQAKVDELISLAQFAQQRGDYTKSNQAFIAAHDVANDWVDKVKATDLAPNAQEKLRSVQLALVKFHKDTTKMLYFTAYALSDYLSTLFLKNHDYDSILQEIDKFETTNPEFAVPGIQSRLYNQAMKASRTRGYADKLEIYEEKHRQWLVQSQYWNQGGGFTEEAVEDTDYAANFIEGDSNDPKVNGNNALGLMLRWLGIQWKRGLISVEDCRDIFYPGLEDAQGETRQDASNDRQAGDEALDFAAYIENKAASEVAESIMGKSQEPVSTPKFLAAYNRLLKWITRNDSPQESQTEKTLLVHSTDGKSRKRHSRLAMRLFALRVFLQSRLHMLRERKVLEANYRDIDVDDAAVYEIEFQTLEELKDMEAVENGVTVDTEDQKLESAIHITLFKCGVTAAVKEGLVDEMELMTRVDDCKKLAAHYRNINHQLFHYNVLCQQLRLLWYLCFLYDRNPLDLITPVQEADALYLHLRRAVASSNPSAQLIAGAKLSEQFCHRVHFNFALAATYTLMKKNHNLNEGTRYRDEFLSWTLKSKGRGFTDMLDLETSVDHTIQQVEGGQQWHLIQKVGETKSLAERDEGPATNEPSLIETEQIQNDLQKSLSYEDGKTALNVDTIRNIEITALLKDLPENVALVDFVNLEFLLPNDTLIATVYRKNSVKTIVEIPGIQMRQISAWLKRNILGHRKPRDQPLSQIDADKRLEELAPLLAPLVAASVEGNIKEGETVILCPTQILNRVPIHAIPVGGVPFIERNLIVYCQSMGILQRLIQRFKVAPRTTQTSRSVVLNPLPDYYPSTARVISLAESLKADLLHGLEYKPSDALQAAQGAKLFHYHGHVEYNPISALDSKILLYDPRPKEKPRKSVKREIIRARDLFGINLDAPALATMIGCGSGITSYSSNDELLGFPTALFYAGASSVVSTLWPILDDDGADFATALYKALSDQAKRIGKDKDTEGKEGNSRTFSRAINLARALQNAILDLRDTLRKKDALLPYHWAAFTLNGFWLVDEETVSPNPIVYEGC